MVATTKESNNSESRNAGSKAAAAMVSKKDAVNVAPIGVRGERESNINTTEKETNTAGASQGKSTAADE